MDIAEVLKLADELIFAKTGENIDYLQEAILRGTLQDQTYAKIAEATHSSEGHVRDVGSGLWKILSEGLGEDITKRNFRVILDSGKIYNFSSGQGHVAINNVNICPQTSQSPQVTQNPQQTPNQPQIDLGDTPEIFNFYDRTPQLSTLETWILQDKSRLIALLGISGIGKTTLALRLIEQIKTNFDYVIYRSLRFSPTLNTTLTNLLQIFSDKTDIPHNIETQISQLLDNLRKYRCLIILDDVQMLFSTGQLAGQYKTGYEDYQQFFKLIAEVCHPSCLILISWEKSREIAKLERVNNYVQSLVLGSLGTAAKEILKQQKLSDDDDWETLINTYQGNPLWLELTTTIIHDLFSGSVSEFLQCDTAILSESLQAQLDQQFQRLTQAEMAIMIQLAEEKEPVALPQIIKTVQLSTSDLLNAMQSLGMRLFLDAEEQGKTTFFSLNPVMKQYVKNRIIK
ncbi:AAA family ATPase [Kamptonema animale CS-326]|jgi:ABC-type dipeptide/oligopeptide/nickel transport system ATPase subunit|uniref:AAA family ATPase n=1 Tax=Kamptonema animale TaxID=92934 RepID=UPI00232BFD12|nr:AAA family ATPase [Kamptonema animale]MDB9511692.1 AAA family ATPase [Kamptonema animale CS-326]